MEDDTTTTTADDTATASAPAKFTQKQVNGFLASRTAELKDRVAQLESELADYQKVKGELTAAGESLTNEVQTLRTTLEGERATRAAAVAKAEAESAAAAQQYRALRVQHFAGAALHTARVHAAAQDVALELFNRRVQVELGDDGAVSGCTFDGTPMTLEQAAVAFLGTHTFFAQASAGGAGASRPTGGGWLPAPEDTRTPLQMVEAGLKEAP